ncbi:hypothetical protein L596_025847 [Steinernema carpocapsae]|uniref:Uncharacterized protein n=1 Tax=Steinernema carpocapsae TaxID=34508 RepID=A0A4U5M973_STECR|nr:hypothetical protein L596_025847 [Steinernema carpocapsae]
MDPWMITLICVGIAAIIVVIVTVVFSMVCHQRKQYQDGVMITDPKLVESMLNRNEAQGGPSQTPCQPPSTPRPGPQVVVERSRSSDSSDNVIVVG